MPNLTYLSLLRGSRSFTLYVLSDLITQFGTWLNFIATLSLLTRILGDGDSGDGDGGNKDNGPASYTPIAVLLLLRMLPGLVISPAVGGPCADSSDKRKIMILLDFSSAFLVGAIFPLASALESSSLLYVAVFSLSSLGAIYNPSKMAIVPVMLTSEEEINKATSLLAMSWSVMAAVGSAVGGAVTEWGGEVACFRYDAVSFLVSGLLLVGVGPGWKKERKGESKAAIGYGEGYGEGSGGGEGEEHGGGTCMRKLTGGVR